MEKDKKIRNPEQLLVNEVIAKQHRVDALLAHGGAGDRVVKNDMNHEKKQL